MVNLGNHVIVNNGVAVLIGRVIPIDIGFRLGQVVGRQTDARVTGFLLIAAVGVVVIVGVSLGHMYPARSYSSFDGNRLCQEVVIIVQNQRAGILVNVFVRFSPVTTVNAVLGHGNALVGSEVDVHSIAFMQLVEFILVNLILAVDGVVDDVHVGLVDGSVTRHFLKVGLLHLGLHAVVVVGSQALVGGDVLHLIAVEHVINAHIAVGSTLTDNKCTVNHAGICFRVSGIGSCNGDRNRPEVSSIRINVVRLQEVVTTGLVVGGQIEVLQLILNSVSATVSEAAGCCLDEPCDGNFANKRLVAVFLTINNQVTGVAEGFLQRVGSNVQVVAVNVHVLAVLVAAPVVAGADQDVLLILLEFGNTDDVHTDVTVGA